jgi:penicillin amidase
MRKRKGINLVLSLIGPIALIVILTMPIGPLAGGLQIIAPTGGIFDVGIGVNQPEMQTVTLPGLEANVVVLQDQWGIPHVYGDTVEDAFMALGYVHARDRLFQMFMQNYLAAGRISEIVGGYAAQSDRIYRTLGFARLAQETIDYYVAHSDDPNIDYTLRTIDAEVAGVNAYIDTLTSATMPIEFKILGFTPPHWTRLDIFIFAHLQSWGLAGGFGELRNQWMRVTIDNDTLLDDVNPEFMPYTVPIISEQYNLSIAEYPEANGGFPGIANPSSLNVGVIAEEAFIAQEKLDVLIDAFDSIVNPFGELDIVGSNNWVANGSKTSTGEPILCNDPHLSFQTPSIWYEAHIVVSGELDVTGVGFAGMPGIVLGHNEHVAWGFTNVGADVLDVFVEQLNPSNPDQYMYNGQYRDFEIVDESILTKEGDVVPFEVKISVHGPLIDSITNTYDQDAESDPNLAMRWTGNDVIFNIVGIGLLNKMSDLDSYYDACFWWDIPAQNIIYADDQGNIALTVCGRYPVRTGYDGSYPVQALNDSIGWAGYIPYAYIPRTVNPSQGYISSANQLSIDMSTYGFELLGPFDDGYRGRRIDYLLANDDDITMDDMKRFQADALEVRAQEIVPYVVDAWTNAGDGNATVDEIVGWLDDWDYRMEPDEKAPTVWMFLRDALHYEVFDEIRSIDSSLPLSRTPVLEEFIRTNNAYYLDDHTTTGVVETRNEILVRAIYRALDNLVADPVFGSDQANWDYGNKHVVYYEHLAGMTTIGGIPHRGQNTLQNAGGWRVEHGPSWRLVADLSNIQMSYGVYAPGQSGNPFSPHFDDLFWLQWVYDKVTEQYGYHQIYFYATAAAFQAADTDGTMIEAVITFMP